MYIRYLQQRACKDRSVLCILYIFYGYFRVTMNTLVLVVG